MTNQAFDEYLLAIDSTLEQRGFLTFRARAPSIDADRTFRRRRFSITNFLEDTFCFVKCVPHRLTTTFLESWSKQVFGFALNNKTWIPRMLAPVIAYPVLVTDTVSDDIRAYIEEQYCPKHFAAFEFPAVVELSSGTVFCYDRTPLYGAALYGGFRREVRRLFRSRPSFEEEGVPMMLDEDQGAKRELTQGERKPVSTVAAEHRHGPAFWITFGLLTLAIYMVERLFVGGTLAIMVGPMVAALLAYQIASRLLARRKD